MQGRCPFLNMHPCCLGSGKTAGTFHHQRDVICLPFQFCRIALLNIADRRQIIDIDMVIIMANISGQMAMYTVIFQQKGSVFYGGKVIDSNYPDSAICALDMGAKNISANPAKPVYGDIITHLIAFPGCFKQNGEQVYFPLYLFLL